MSYKLKLDIFEGPLDLLLYLIRKDDIDIQDIPIAEITEQYLRYIEMMSLLDLDVVGDFLVMAATLMQIKSRMLLPPDPFEEDEEELDPRAELARRLEEYKQFKMASECLHEKERDRKKYIARIVNEEEIDGLREDAREYVFEANLFDLINAFSEAMRRVPEDSLHEIVQEEYTVEEKIHDLLHLFVEREEIHFFQLISSSRSRTEAIVTFLAILELTRLREICVIQDSVFADIRICRNSENIRPSKEELEHNE